METYILPFAKINKDAIGLVGGKNASLGEMMNNLSALGIQVPNGFATTVHAFTEFLAHNNLDERIDQALHNIDVDNTQVLAQVGEKIRTWIEQGELQPAFAATIQQALMAVQKQAGAELSFAVRSSATAEDLPSASFAGQQETFLNIRGLEAIKVAIRKVFASLYNDRAIAYRVHKDFAHQKIAISAGIQRMVRSDKGVAGVMFTLDTESGFKDAIFITAAYGLGESVVQGIVNPDEFYTYKANVRAKKPAVIRRNLGSKLTKIVYTECAEPGKSVQTVQVDEADRYRFCLTDQEIDALSQQALLIEDHYGMAMDIEWAKDGEDQGLFILQARPETVKSQITNTDLERYTLKSHAKVLCEGRSIGQKIGAGKVCLLHSVDDMHLLQAGDVLVTAMTDPDWEPVMKKSAAIVTDRGGRTCHAAIIARELGIPAVVGCGDATSLPNHQPVTVSCAEGDTGYVYEGLLDYEVKTTPIDTLPELPFKIMLNVGNPERAFDFAQIPNHGVGLARLEFIINRMIGVHPKALLHFDKLPAEIRESIQIRMAGYADPVQFYVDKLVEGVATIAAAFYPKKVIVRLSDFKSNEYANLIGGRFYEPKEENPMLGFRGASRYIEPAFADCFALECRALKYVRDTLELTNVELMVPFVRTPEEAKKTLECIAKQGLQRGKNGLRIIMMCELPANALLADAFLEQVDGFSIGSNDMTQLTLGLDRDSGLLAHLFDERDAAVKSLLAMAISAAKRVDKYVGICGQGPSDHPDFAKWLIEQGIDSVSLNPDTVVKTWCYLASQ